MIRRAVNSRSFPYIWLWIFTLLSIRTAGCETPSNRQVKIQTINYNWVDEEKVEVTVCLESEADGTPFGQLDLLVTNDLGRAWRARGGGGGGGGGGASRKTEEAFCFAGLSLEKKDLAKTLRFRVLETGRDDPVQELETFVIVPEVTPASEGAYEICWEDPEGLAFALAEGGVARPLVAPSAGCHECCLAVAPKNPGDLVTLETAGAKDLRQLVQIRLPADLAGGQMKPRVAVPLTIKELQKVSREDDPSGRRQNMRVFLDPHEAIEADDFQLELIVGSNGFQEIHHLSKIIDEDATELEFEGNFKDSIQVFIKAMKGGVTVGFGSVTQEMTDPGSRVAKVGDASAPSLRVDPGARDQVEVPGKPPCVRGSGPCYYVGQSDPPPPLCEDLAEIRFCDAVVSEAQNPAEVPALELRNRQELRVQQPRPDGAWTEVVVSSAQDDSILSLDGFGCDDLGDGKCAHPVAVADDLDGFDVTLVVLDDEGYVMASLAVPFEVHGVAALSLFQDVLQVAVDPRSGGAYEVTLAGPSPPPAATLECQAGSPCRVWFAGVDAPPAVTVRKGSNAIYEATSGPPPPASRVERLTSRDADARMDVEVASDKHVTRADLVTFSSDVATDADCESLAATPSKSGYSVAASSRGAGDWNFLVVGYDDDGALLEAGRAHVTLSDILLPRMTKLGTEALQSLKVETGEMDVKVNGFLCPASTVCYYLEPENILEPPEVCRMAAPNIEQCDMTAAYIQPESLIERSVQLSFTGVPEEDLMITADFSETSLTMEAKLYTNSEDLTPNPLTCEITGRSPKTCTFKVEPKVTEFKILLMALDSESTVKDSTVVEFEDFQTRIQQLTLDAIEVRWQASQNQEYDVEIVSETDGKIDSTSVICGGEKPEDSKVCLAYFFPLNLNEDYTASVRVQGDNKYVSASVRMQPVLETINIKELTLTTTGETRGLTVCFMESREKRKQNEGEKIVNKFVAVDVNGRQVQMVSKSSHSSISDVEEKLCLGPLPLDLDFNLSDKVRVLVSRENLDTQEILLSGDAELFVSDPPPKDDKVVIVISVVGVVVAVVAIGSLGAISLMKSKNERENLHRQEEPPLTLPVYATWGARRLGRTAQPPREHGDCTNNESANTAVLSDATTREAPSLFP